MDIAVHDINLWFLTEDQLLDKNILQLLPPSTYRKIYPEFKKVLLRGEVSSRNYELATDSKTYFFKCIMRPYEDMVLCQYRDITERSQRKLELEKKNYELNEIQKVALIGRWWYDSGKECICYSGYSDITLDEEQQTVSLDSYITHILPEDREIFCKWLDENLQGDMTRKRGVSHPLPAKSVLYPPKDLLLRETTRWTHCPRRIHTEHHRYPAAAQ